MPQENNIPDPTATVDVAICGGGLAGLLLALQIRMELPQLSVSVLESTSRPLPDACHKVGESSVELGSQYLERLGLGEYLEREHLYKLGLRFFPGGGQLPLVERTEIGPSAEPIIHSYQLDRGLLETDLRRFVEEAGATLIEGARVTDVDLQEDADHGIDYLFDGASERLHARWVFDATGRAAVLRRKFKSTRKLPHKANAGWFRVKGRVDICDLVPASESKWHERPGGDERWRSTNHFMGRGYWAWVIPLSTGNTSIGLVVHDEEHGHQCTATHESVTAFLAEHEPHLLKLLQEHEVMDFLCLRNYSNSVGRAWSEQRWAMVGEAGAFVDPLYSPGTDFIALANCFSTEMLHVEAAGGDLQAKASQLNNHYRSMVQATTELFRHAAPVYAHPSAMSMKVYWDNFAYWSYTCQFFKQNLCKLDSAGFAPFGEVGMRFFSLGNRIQGLLSAWADLAPEEPVAKFLGAPHFPSVLIDAHIQLADDMTPPELLEYMRMRLAEAEEIAAELVLRVVQLLGPDLAEQVLERARFGMWEIKHTSERLAAEREIGNARKKLLTPIARDVERSLGRIVRHADAGRALDLLAAGVSS
ncbi:MAG: flavin-dependent dehydrogenase [Planctomycetota bacterium]|jgi:flavin-dependent dehydrogenase